MNKAIIKLRYQLDLQNSRLQTANEEIEKAENSLRKQKQRADESRDEIKNLKEAIIALLALEVIKY